LLSYLISKK